MENCNHGCKQKPMFLNFLSEESFSSHLTISKEHLTDFNGKLWNTIYLKGPISKKLHKIEVELGELSITLKDGWQKFVGKNALQKHDILFFWYEELNLFDVTVFDNLGRNIREKRGNGCFGNNLVKGGPSRKIAKRKALYVEYFSVLPKKVRINTQGPEILDMSSDHDSCDGNEISRCKEPKSNKGKNIVEELSGNKTEESESWCSDSHASESVFTSSDSSRELDMSESELKRRQKTVRIVVSTPRKPIFISRRRPVTDKEKERVIHRAEKFESDNPTFMKGMKKHNVYKTFSLPVPIKFARKYFQNKSSEVSLRLAGNGGGRNGKRWRVDCHYTFSKSQSQWRLSSGWKHFSFQNNLEEGDMCIFELTRREKQNEKEKVELTVHVFRVVEEMVRLVEKSI